MISGYRTKNNNNNNNKTTTKNPQVFGVDELVGLSVKNIQLR